MSAPVSSRVRKAARPDPSESLRPLTQPNIHIEGQVSRGFEAVAGAFAENFTLRRPPVEKRVEGERSCAKSAIHALHQQANDHYRAARRSTRRR